MFWDYFGDERDYGVVFGEVPWVVALIFIRWLGVGVVVVDSGACEVNFG